VEAAQWQRISEKASRLLSNGAALLFFPEGHRSRTGRLQRFYSGAFKLAAETGIKIVPLCIKGTHEILPPGRWWFKPGRVTVKALEPVDPRRFTESAAHRTMRKIVKARMAQALMEKSVDAGNTNKVAHPVTHV
jgi:1-acyl-sn-glycerol-3-phosphate acyltransferase